MRFCRSQYDRNFAVVTVSVKAKAYTGTTPMEGYTIRQQPLSALRGPSPLLRMASDERLVELTRRGQQSAFEALVGRYQARLLAFCRHMLASREDAEDVLQEVFAAAFNALLADEREINVRPWLYRIARNRSLNHLRRATAIGVDSMDVHVADGGVSTSDKAHRREEFRLLMDDISRLPETQRSALVLREMDALSYEQIADAMETTVPSVKSLLVRARIGLAEAAQARKLTCDEVRVELGARAEGLASLTAPARRHVKDCDLCRGFQTQLRANNRALAALLPIGPLFLVKKMLLVKLGLAKLGGAGAGGAAAGSGAAAAGSGAAAATGGVALGAVAVKAAVVVAVAAIATTASLTLRHQPRAAHVSAAVPAVTPPPALPVTNARTTAGAHHGGPGAGGTSGATGGLSTGLAIASNPFPGCWPGESRLLKGLLHDPQCSCSMNQAPASIPAPGSISGGTSVASREEAGVTVLVTTHLMEEAERRDRLAILDSGRIVALGTPAELRSSLGGDCLTIESSAPEELARRIAERLEVCPAIVAGQIRVEVGSSHEFVGQLLESFGSDISSISLGKPNVEDVFVHIAPAISSGASKKLFSREAQPSGGTRKERQQNREQKEDF